MPQIAGPDFIALQVKDLEKSRVFYRDTFGLCEALQSLSGAVVFAIQPILFAVREPLPHDEAQVQQAERLGLGMALWLHCDDPDGLYVQLQNAGVPLPQPVRDGPFGRFFTFIDPDGYRVTVHGK